ncbi:MAG: hypothetical protein IJV34_08150 [Prevotella sp.]|nr:hypothetical protein [Prevotella sp.]
MSGATINFNAYQALMAGHHRMSILVGLLLFASFFVFSYLILSRQKLSEALTNQASLGMKWQRAAKRALVAMCSWIGFSTYLSILCVVTYALIGEVYDILLTATLFDIVNILVRLKTPRYLWDTK